MLQNIFKQQNILAVDFSFFKKQGNLLSIESYFILYFLIVY